MAAKDRAQVEDGVAATIEAVPVDPVFPCPSCGAESREHGEPPRHDESQRICSWHGCRLIHTAQQEAERTGPFDPRPHFPCPQCGRETKVLQSGRAGATTQRVCSDPVCRNVFEL